LCASQVKLLNDFCYSYTPIPTRESRLINMLNLWLYSKVGIYGCYFLLFILHIPLALPTDESQMLVSFAKVTRYRSFCLIFFWEDIYRHVLLSNAIHLLNKIFFKLNIFVQIHVANKNWNQSQSRLNWWFILYEIIEKSSYSGSR
jgi:hypothetical protein